MPNNPQNVVALLLAIATFGLILSIWLGGVLLWSIARKRRDGAVAERLRSVQPEAVDHGTGRVLRLWHDGREATILVDDNGPKAGMLASLDRIRTDAGLESPASSILLGLGSTIAVVGIGAYLLTFSPIAALAAAVAVLIAFYIYVAQRISRRKSTFERQLVDALDLAARSLRVGHPLVASFRLISEEIPNPIGGLFGEVCQQQELGVAMDQALREVSRRNDSEDLKLFSTSVVIQLRSGGNLADMMERLANVIRERIRLARRVNVLTAQTQFSKRILLALPFFVFVLLTVINESYMRPLWTTFAGQAIAISSAVMLLLGWMMMNWVSRLTP